MATAARGWHLCLLRTIPPLRRLLLQQASLRPCPWIYWGDLVLLESTVSPFQLGHVQSVLSLHPAKFSGMTPCPVCHICAQHPTEYQELTGKMGACPNGLRFLVKHTQRPSVFWKAAELWSPTALDPCPSVPSLGVNFTPTPALGAPWQGGAVACTYERWGPPRNSHHRPHQSGQ